MSDLCEATIEYEPEPCMGSIEVKCPMKKGHKGEHHGIVEVADFVGVPRIDGTVWLNVTWRTV